MKRLVPGVPPHVRLLHPALATVAGREFTRIEHCIVFSGQTHLNRRDFPDATGYESFANHIHIHDFVAEGDSEHSVEQGFVLAASLNERLREFAPGTAFRFIIAVNADGCTLRFHVVRSGEQWETEDLELYEEEAIAVIESCELPAASTAQGDRNPAAW